MLGMERMDIVIGLFGIIGRVNYEDTGFQEYIRARGRERNLRVFFLCYRVISSLTTYGVFVYRV